MTLDREERLRIVAAGKCSATSRKFGSKTMWVPTIDGMVAQISEEEDECFIVRREAVQAAREFRDEARKRLSEDYGDQQ